MKKLILGLVSALFLASTTAQAVIFARQVWQHPNGKIVELFFDAHAEYLEKNYKDLLVSGDIDNKVKKQQLDILNYAKLFDNKVHIFVEDIATALMNKFPHLKSAILKSVDTGTRETLALLVHLCDIHAISATNIDNRLEDAGVDVQELLSNLTALSSLMDLAVIHDIDDYTDNKKFIGKNRLIIIAGAQHNLMYSRALAHAGYKCINSKTKFHYEVQKIVDSPDGLLEHAIQSFINRFLNWPHHNTDLHTEENLHWATAFLVTHPLDIAQIIEEERKELVAVPVAAATHAETKEIAAARMAAPVVVTPVIRSRL